MRSYHKNWVAAGLFGLSAVIVCAPGCGRVIKKWEDPTTNGKPASQDIALMTDNFAEGYEIEGTYSNGFDGNENLPWILAVAALAAGGGALVQRSASRNPD